MNETTVQPPPVEPMLIPRYFHTFLPKGATGEAAVETGFPNWQLRHWNTGHMDEIMDSAVCSDLLSDPLLHPVLRADILAYEIMRIYGGVFASPSFRFLKSFEDIIVLDCMHLAVVRGRVISNTLLASPPGFGFWDFFLHRIRGLATRPPMNPREILWWTGEHSLTESVRMWLGNNWHGRALTGPDGALVAQLYEHGDIVLWNRNVVSVHRETADEVEEESARFEPYASRAIENPECVITQTCD